MLREPSVLREDIRKHLEAENAYTESALAGTKALQAKMVDEMKGRMQQDESSVPSVDGPFAYFSRYAEGNEHPLLCRISRSDFEDGRLSRALLRWSPQPPQASDSRSTLSAGEGGRWSPEAPLVPSLETLLDANALADGQDFFKLGAVEHSPNHKLVAYATDVKGSEYFEIAVKDIATGELLADRLVNCSASFEWSADGTALFYTVIDENHRAKFVYRHALGTEQADDTLIYEEPDDGMFLGVGLTESRRFLTIASNDHETSEVRLLDAADPAAKPFLVQKRTPGVSPPPPIVPSWTGGRGADSVGGCSSCTRSRITGTRCWF